jgi:methylphosphotriester-DNA--protein-cysteine methyltransferase
MSGRSRIIAVILAVIVLAAGAAWLVHHQRTTAAASANPASSVTVYVTDTGECYHRGSCTSLRYSKYPMSLAQARQDYRPCKRCRPPQ